MRSAGDDDGLSLGESRREHERCGDEKAVEKTHWDPPGKTCDPL
jgi:hypothetical protein